MKHLTNGIKLSQTIYLAYNQNGLNNCLYDFYGDRYSKINIRRMVQNYPKLDNKIYKGLSPYPCVFSIIDKTLENNKIYLDIVSPFTFNELVHSSFRNI